MKEKKWEIWRRIHHLLKLDFGKYEEEIQWQNANFNFKDLYKLEKAIKNISEQREKEINKCSICEKESNDLTKECPDCYLKGCKIELDKQKKEIFEDLKRIEQEGTWEGFIRYIEELKQQIQKSGEK